MNISSLPTVSVVVPMFNVEQYVSQCISSVLAQTYHHFELILVDDGCTDQTLARVNQFDDARIHIVSQRNRGLSGARNTGINAARGLYIAILDADDFWAKDKLLEHVKHLNESPDVGISYCPSLLVNEQGAPLGIGQFPKLTAITQQHVFCRNPIGNGSAPVIRRAVFDSISFYGNGADKYRKMYFNECLKQSEDIELWTRIALSTPWRFEGIATPLTFYRVNESGLSSDVEKQFGAWQSAVQLNYTKAPNFFAQHYRLAKAYQLRYLARRAVRSGDRFVALKLIHRALICDIRILFQEPCRTAITLASAWLKFISATLYLKLEKKMIYFLGKRRIS